LTSAFMLEPKTEASMHAFSHVRPRRVWAIPEQHHLWRSRLVRPSGNGFYLDAPYCLVADRILLPSTRPAPIYYTRYYIAAWVPITPWPETCGICGCPTREEWVNPKVRKSDERPCGCQRRRYSHTMGSHRRARRVGYADLRDHPLAMTRGHEPPVSRYTEGVVGVVRPEHWRCNAWKGSRLDSELPPLPLELHAGHYGCKVARSLSNPPI
jgi:hypothetical protein